jgi:hypothetical protein
MDSDTEACGWRQSCHARRNKRNMEYFRQNSNFIIWDSSQVLNKNRSHVWPLLCTCYLKKTSHSFTDIKYVFLCTCMCTQAQTQSLTQTHVQLLVQFWNQWSGNITFVKRILWDMTLFDYIMLMLFWPKKKYNSLLHVKGNLIKILTFNVFWLKVLLEYLKIIMSF